VVLQLCKGVTSAAAGDIGMLGVQVFVPAMIASSAAVSRR